MKPQPFKNIAISLSGGGYRAAAFHLGALSLLNEIKIQSEKNEGEPNSLLDRVKIISTISGGTIPGMVFAQARAKDQSFEVAFKKLYDLLKKDTLADDAMALVNNSSKWEDDYRSKNLINAFAEIYNRDFFVQDTFEIISDRLDDSDGIEFIFNSTDLSNGLGFRFQKTGKFGNKYIKSPKIEEKTIKPNDIKLGDIVAASSCFPLAFEPMIFPKDFSPSTQSFAEKESIEPIGIMDGGIIDNHGFKAIELADKRLRKNNESIGTYIVSSVEGKNITPFEIPDAGRQYFLGKMSLSGYRKISVILIIALFSLNIGIHFCPALPKYISEIILVSSTVLITVSTIFLIGLGWARKKISKLIQTTFHRRDLDLLQRFSIIEKLNINTLIDLIMLRAGSFISMTQDVFLRQIRRLQFKVIFNSKEWRKRSMSNFIYKLQDDTTHGLNNVWKDIIDTAVGMETTLWFTDTHRKNNMLDKLIQSGQLTTCISLLRHIEKLKKIPTSKRPTDLPKKSTFQKLSDAKREDIDLIENALLKMKKELLSDPGFLLKPFKV